MDGLESDDYYDIAELESSDEERADAGGSDSDGGDAAAAADDGQRTQGLYLGGDSDRGRKSYRKGKEKQGGDNSSNRGKATQRRQVYYYLFVIEIYISNSSRNGREESISFMYVCIFFLL